MKRGLKKCAYCLTYQKVKARKGKKVFCSQEHKQAYYDNDIPTLKKEIQIEFNRMVTEAQPCAVCGKKFEKMDCSHILSRGGHDHLRFDILNVLPMCSRCHRWFWHDDPLKAMEWFKAKYPERYDYLMFADKQFKSWTTDELRQIREVIEKKEVKKLIRFYEEYRLATQKEE